jgi:hypothetical protein
MFKTVERISMETDKRTEYEYATRLVALVVIVIVVVVVVVGGGGGGAICHRTSFCV